MNRVPSSQPGIKRATRSIALTIAGSDSGGGAGIQADLKVFAALGVHGTTAITCITAQNPGGVQKIQTVTPAIVSAQMEAVFDELPPAAIKTGMLFSEAIIRTVVEGMHDFLASRKPGKLPIPFLVVDPVMVATSGAMLLKPSAAKAIQERLLPLASMVTPNIDETEVLLGRKVRSLESARCAARELFERFGCSALVKGGHLKPGIEAVDFFYDGKDELMLTAPYIKGASTHGTGCTYSAAITACLAKGSDFSSALLESKQFITTAIATGYKIGNHFALNPASE